jgi:hypothetical protein
MGMFICDRCQKQWPDVVYFSCPECHPRWAIFQAVSVIVSLVVFSTAFTIAFLVAIVWFAGRLL